MIASLSPIGQQVLAVLFITVMKSIDLFSQIIIAMPVTGRAVLPIQHLVLIQSLTQIKVAVAVAPMGDHILSTATTRTISVLVALEAQSGHLTRQ